MTFVEAIWAYREKATGMVSNQRNPVDHSCQNGLLFSSTYMVLRQKILGINTRSPDPQDEWAWFANLIESCMPEPGKLTRYPGTKDLTRQDDIIGVACATHIMGMTSTSASFYQYGSEHDFCWSWDYAPLVTDRPSFLGRYPNFIPLLMAMAGKRLQIWHQVAYAGAILADMFSERNETSDRCLMYLQTRAMWGKYRIIDAAISLWRWRMGALYPGGMREVYSIYFGKGHPFAVYGPVDFN